jgi:hypothetical protein
MGTVRGVLAGAVLLAGATAGMSGRLGELLPLNFPTPRAEHTITPGQLVNFSDHNLSSVIQVTRLEWTAEADDVVSRGCRSNV